MKKYLGSFGKAVCYYLLFLGMQFIMVGCLAVSYMAFLLTTGESVDAATEALLEAIAVFGAPVTLLSNLLSVAVVFILFYFQNRVFRNEVGIRPVSRKLKIQCAFFAYGLCMVVLMVLSLLPESLMADYSDASEILTEASGFSPINFLATVIVAPICEEIFFRGLIYSRLRRAMSFVPSFIITGILFGLAHGNLVWGCYAFALSTFMCIILERHHSLTLTITMHITFNLVGGYMGRLPLPDAVLSLLVLLGFVIFAVMGYQLIIKTPLPEPLPADAKFDPDNSDES